MLKTRVIPCLLLRNRGLVKTVTFRDPSYLGDPINIVRIFNDKEVDELTFLDITATAERRGPLLDHVSEIASECFMPLAYGGGIRDLDDIRRVLAVGVEKVVINSYAVEDPSFIEEAARLFGSQSIVVSIDVKKTLLGRYEVFTHSGQKRTRLDPVKHAVHMQERGAGELLLTSIDRDGTMKGYDLDLTRRVCDSVSVPVIACGGASHPNDFRLAVDRGGASAAAAGSLFVFQGKLRAVLISYPSYEELKRLLGAGVDHV